MPIPVCKYFEYKFFQVREPAKISLNIRVTPDFTHSLDASPINVEFLHCQQPGGVGKCEKFEGFPQKGYIVVL